MKHGFGANVSGERQAMGHKRSSVLLLGLYTEGVGLISAGKAFGIELTQGEKVTLSRCLSFNVQLLKIHSVERNDGDLSRTFLLR